MQQDQVVLEASMEQSLRSLPEKRDENDPKLIFRVPDYVRESCIEHYNPRMISIGPYHHGVEKLRAMEQHKLRYLRDFLTRNIEVNLNVYIQAMCALEEQARQSFGEIVDLNSNDFVKMLLLDGCFIIELMFKFEYGERDALHKFGWGMMTIISDLLLLENQIPFFVLIKLFTIVTNESIDRLLWLFANYLATIARLDASVANGRNLDLDTPVHLLHLYHALFTSRNHARSPPRVIFNERRYLGINSTLVKYPASLLIDFGVRFKKNTWPCGVFDITFENGIIKIPQITIDSNFKIQLKNLLAFEESIEPDSRSFSSFVVFMDCLVKTPKDVEILEERGIIENFLSSTEEATSFFSDLTEWVTLDLSNHMYAGIFCCINQYCNLRWHTYRAKAQREYFNNPFALISFISSMVSVLFTLVQTLITYLTFKRGC